jgi:hypothetical protein
MVYTPRLTDEASATIKSLSFTLGIPMTRTLDRAIALLPLLFHPIMVCEKCEDKSRCNLCAFNQKRLPDDISKLMPTRG